MSSYNGITTLAAAAQKAPEAAPPAPSAHEKDEIVELSPFVVSSDSDKGYLATSSLAGTRIRADLKDIANSISVVTSEYLADIDATNPTGLLVYTGNMEAGGVEGNYSGANTSGGAVEHSGVTRNPQSNTRVRGLASADLTRAYYPTSIVFDSYNIDRVEISRGPNASLFGLGSPGGIVNSQLVAPRMKNATKFEFGYGSYGTTRTTMDIDRVIVPKRLGLRITSLYEDERYTQKFTFERDKRLYAALTYKPFDNGTLRINFEKGKVTANRPIASAPRDTLTRWWLPAFNKNTHDPSTENWGAPSTAMDLVRGPGEWFGQPALVFESNNANTAARFMRGWYTRYPTTFQANMGSLTAGGQWFASPTAAALGVKYGSFFKDKEIDDFSVFDWRNNLLQGPNKREWEGFSVLNASYDHTFHHPLGIVGFEIAGSRERHSGSWYDLLGTNRGYTINIDLNTKLPWGDVNPNFGRPFVAGSGTNTRNETNNLHETARATAFIELDFANKTNSFRWLGRHNLTAFANEYVRHTDTYQGRNRTDVDWSNAAYAGSPTPAASALYPEEVRTVVYIGPRLDGLSSPKGINLQGLQTVITPGGVTTVNGYDWNRASRAFTTRNANVYSALDDNYFYQKLDGGSLQKQTISSQVFIEQAHLLPKGALVATVSYRTDKMKDYRKNGGDANVRTAQNYIDRSDPDWTVPSVPSSVFEESTWSYGGVLHSDPFFKLPAATKLSIHWSKSENFQPSNARIDIFGKPIAPPGGTTKEYGFSVSVLDDKFLARFNWFETLSIGASQGYNSFLWDTDSRLIAYNSPEVLAAAGFNGPPQFFKDLTNWRVITTAATLSGYQVQLTVPGNMSDTVSTSSKGFETELTFNPNNNWRFALNVSQQKAQRSDMIPATQAYLTYRLDEWLHSPLANIRSDDSGEPVNTRVQGTLLNGINSLIAQSGQNVSELREWRANLVGNYTFRSTSMFKGFNVGSGIRWQDKVGIGYPIITVQSPTGSGTIDIPNLKTPYYGPCETNIDTWIGYSRRIWNGKVNWRIQLNVKNLLGKDDIIPVYAQPDGSIASWMAPVGRTFSIKSSFEF